MDSMGIPVGYFWDLYGSVGLLSVWLDLMGCLMDSLGFQVSFRDLRRILWDFQWIPWDSLGFQVSFGDL